MKLKKSAVITLIVVGALAVLAAVVGPVWRQPTGGAKPVGKSAPTATVAYAVLTAVTGEVWLERSGGQTSAAVGDRISRGEKLKTGDGSASFSFDDAVFSRLEANTEIELADVGGNGPIMRQSSGVLWSTLVPNVAVTSVVVRTAGGDVRAVGTDFVTTPQSVLTASGAVDVGGTLVNADEKYDFAQKAKVALGAAERQYLADGLDIGIGELKRNRARIVAEHAAEFDQARATVGIDGKAPLADAYGLFFDGVDEGSLGVGPLVAAISDWAAASKIEAITAAIKDRSAQLENKGYAVGLASDRKAVLPPPRSLAGEARPLTQEDRILAALMAAGIETAAFSKGDGTFGVYYEQPSLVTADQLTVSVVSVFTMLGAFETENENFSVTPYGIGNDKPFLTYLASRKDVADYLQGTVKLADFLKKVRTKEDLNALKKSCQEAIKNSHDDAAGSGYCVCDDGYDADYNTQFKYFSCLKKEIAPPPLPPPVPGNEPGVIVPPTTALPPIAPPAAEPPKTPTEPPIAPPPASATVKKGRTTLKSQQFPGTVEQFSFDNGVMTGSSHRYDYDFEFIYNDTYKNPSVVMSDGEGKGWALSGSSFDAMALAPAAKYCGYDILPTTEADPCNYIAPKVGQNYWLRTASGGMIKDGSGKTIALGGKVRYAKIHIVSVSPEALTFDWAFQTEENDRNLK